MGEAQRLADESMNLVERRLESDGYEWSVDADVQLLEAAAALRRLAPMEAELQRTREEIAELRTQAVAWQKHCDTLLHQVLCCGVAASHPDATLTTRGAYAGKWNSAQAEEVRKLRIDRDQTREELAALRASLSEPVLFVSPEQLLAHKDIEDGEFGAYLPARKTAAGKFTQPLFAIKDTK
jgi:hypothetical protein